MVRFESRQLGGKACVIQPLCLSEPICFQPHGFSATRALASWFEGFVLCLEQRQPVLLSLTAAGVQPINYQWAVNKKASNSCRKTHRIDSWDGSILPSSLWGFCLSPKPPLVLLLPPYMFILLRPGKALTLSSQRGESYCGFSPPVGSRQTDHH